MSVNMYATRRCTHGVPTVYPYPQYPWLTQPEGRRVRVLTGTGTGQPGITRGLPVLIPSYFTALVFTVCLCRHPTKKLVTLPAVKHEQVSDVDLWPPSQQPKGKVYTRLEFPIVITSDDSGSDQLPDTPNVKAPRSGTIPKAL